MFSDENPFWILRIRQIQYLAAIGLVFLLSTWMAAAAPSYLAGVDRSQTELWSFFSHFAFLIFFLQFIQTANHLKLVLGLVVLAILGTAASALFYQITGGGDIRATASYGIQMAQNSNYLAFYCLFAICVIWYFRESTTSLVFKSLSVLTIAVLIFIVLLTASRNAFLNLGILAIIFSLEAGLNFRKLFMTVLIIASMTIGAAHFVPEKNMKRIVALQVDPTQKEASQSLKERQASLKTGLEMFSNSSLLLGVGPGNFRWKRMAEYDHKRVATHNSYLWALVSGGILSIGLYLALFWKTWIDLRILEQQSSIQTKAPLWMIKTVRTSLIMFLVFSLFANAWLGIMPYLLWGITITLKKLQTV